VLYSYGHIIESYKVMSHDRLYDKCGKMMYKPCSSCISSIEKSNENSIKFFLLTQIKSRIKLLRLSSYIFLCTKSKKKRNINNSLAILPSYNILLLFKFCFKISNYKLVSNYL